MPKDEQPSDKAEELVSSSKSERMTLRLTQWQLDLLDQEDKKRGNGNYNETIRELIEEADQKVTLPENFVPIPEVAYEKLKNMSDRGEILSIDTLALSLLEDFYTGAKKEQLSQNLQKRNSLSSLVLSDDLLSKASINEEDVYDVATNSDGSRTCYIIGALDDALFTEDDRIYISNNVLKAAEAVSAPISRLYNRKGLNPSELIIKRGNDKHVKVLVGFENYKVVRGFGPDQTTENMIGLNFYIPVSSDCYFKISFAKNDPDNYRLLFVYSGDAAQMLNDRSQQLGKDRITLEQVSGLDNLLKEMHGTVFNYDSFTNPKALPSGIIPDHYMVDVVA